MFSILLILFTVIPAIEIYLLMTIGGHIGPLNTLWIVLVTGVLGAGLAKSQGYSIIQKLQRELQNNSLPALQIIHGLLVFAGGLLLLTPGFLTDLIGFSFVIPGSRHFMAHLFIKMFQKMVANGSVNFTHYSQTSNQTKTVFESHESEKQSNSVPIQNGDTFEAEYKKK